MANRQQTLSGLEGVLADSKVGASLLKLTDGITCVEKIGGFAITVSYSVLDREEAPAEKTSRPHCLQLREERSIRALKPMASLAKFKNESPVKTQNLLHFLEAFSKNGGDLVAALGEMVAVNEINYRNKAD